jgi:hypothetical protein
MLYVETQAMLALHYIKRKLGLDVGSVEYFSGCVYKVLYVNIYTELIQVLRQARIKQKRRVSLHYKKSEYYEVQHCGYRPAALELRELTTC